MKTDPKTMDIPLPQIVIQQDQDHVQTVHVFDKDGRDVTTLLQPISQAGCSMSTQHSFLQGSLTFHAKGWLTGGPMADVEGGVKIVHEQDGYELIQGLEVNSMEYFYSKNGPMQIKITFDCHSVN